MLFGLTGISGGSREKGGLYSQITLRNKVFKLDRFLHCKMPWRLTHKCPLQSPQGIRLSLFPKTSDHRILCSWIDLGAEGSRVQELTSPSTSSTSNPRGPPGRQPDQCCPIEPSAMLDTFYVCTVQYSSHRPPCGHGALEMWQVQLEN